MIPISLGPKLGTSFGSSDDLVRVGEISKQNFRAFKKWHTLNPTIFHNDELFVRLIHIIEGYQSRKLNIERLIPNLSQSLGFVYRNYHQRFHQTHLGRLMIIPVYNDQIDLFKVLYSDSLDLNYNQALIINSTSIVTINMKMLSELISYYNKRDMTINELISREITIPLNKAIHDFAMFNTITNSKHITLQGNDEPGYYKADLNKYFYDRRKKIHSMVNGREMNPLDIMGSIPIVGEMEWVTIEDEYINNLLWINLFSYRTIIQNCMQLNKATMYRKFERAYSLYKPRGRSDGYFTNTSSEVLDFLEETNFI